MNSSYNVGLPQQRRIQEELFRAVFLMGKREDQWRSIYDPSNFFERYEHFLQIVLRANNSDDFMKWLQLCESRLRILIAALDSGPEVSAWPFGQFMKKACVLEDPSDTSNQASHMDGPHETFFFIGLRFALGVETLNLKQYSSEFLYNHINSWEGRKPGMDFLMSHVLQQDLPLDLIELHLKMAPVTKADLAFSEGQRTVNTCDSEEQRTFSVPNDEIPELHASDSGDDSIVMMSPTKRRRSSVL